MFARMCVCVHVCMCVWVSHVTAVYSSSVGQVSSAYTVKKWQKQFEGSIWLAVLGKSHFLVSADTNRKEKELNK